MAQLAADAILDAADQAGVDIDIAAIHREVERPLTRTEVRVGTNALGLAVYETRWV